MKKVKGLLWIVVMGAMLNLTSCLNQDTVEDPSKQLKADIAEIDAYLDANVFTEIVKDPYGIRMEIIDLGTGLPAKSTATTVDVDYVGRLFSNNTIFDQGNVRTLLSNLIDGWKIAFTTLPVGSTARIYVPSSLAYGNVTRTGIPANSILVFDVEFNEAVITTAETNQFKLDTAAIHKYIKDTPVANAINDATGISYVVTQTGTGSNATWFDKLTVKFTYKLLTAPSSVVATVSQAPSEYFYSRSVDYIHGLKFGLQQLNKGSKATFYIPSGLAFGPLGAKDGNGALIIPANANLIVDVELTNVAP